MQSVESVGSGQTVAAVGLKHVHTGDTLVAFKVGLRGGLKGGGGLCRMTYGV